MFYSLLLLLLLLNDEENEPVNPYLEFFFTMLKTQKEKQKFLNDYNNKFIKDLLNDLIELFIKYPINHPEIHSFCERKLRTKNSSEQESEILQSKLIEISEGSSVTDIITKFQKQFYQDAIRFSTQDNEVNNSVTYYNRLKEVNNPSFLYYIGEDEALLQIRLADYHFTKNRENLTIEEIKNYYLNRLKASRSIKI